MATGELVGDARGPESVAAVGSGGKVGPTIERLAVSGNTYWHHPQQSLSYCRYGLCVGTTTEMFEESR